MKLYEFEAFPNPRRVRIFLAEKGLTVDREQVDVPGGAHREKAFTSRNPIAGVPMLELDDGRHICETTAISRYFEESAPEPALMGRDPAEAAEIDMWQRRIEQGVFDKLLAFFHHATPGLGALETYQNKEWGEVSREAAIDNLRKLEPALEDRDYIAGDFSIADITGLCTLDLAGACGVAIPDDCPNLQAWHDRLSARPSAAA